MINIELENTTLLLEEAEIFVIGATEILNHAVIKRNLSFLDVYLWNSVLYIFLIFSLYNDFPLVSTAAIIDGYHDIVLLRDSFDLISLFSKD